MKTLTEIIHQPGLRIDDGRMMAREAVRGIILRGGNILMIYSTTMDVYAFPGGGVQPDETYEDTLIREVREECGARVTSIQGAFGRVIEYFTPREPEYDVFRMDSLYYRCRVEDALGQQTLEPYEADLGLTPLWVNIDAAIETNRAVMADDARWTPRWTVRELFVLEQVREQMGGKVC